MSITRCAVIGHPVAHSLSPVLHRTAYAHLGLDWSYDAVDVDPGGLRDHLGTLGEEWRGLSVTAPHKRDALELAHHVSETARAAGGANTLVLDRGGVTADNTDVPGMVNAWHERGIGPVETVRILGGGATAASAVLAACRAGATRIELRVRDVSRAEPTRRLADELGVHLEVAAIDDPVSAEADLLISTVPADAATPHAAALVSTAAAVFDVVYDPWPTGLAAEAARLDLPVVDGLDLLVHQAVLQIELMVPATAVDRADDRRVPVEILRSAALAALG